MELTAVVIEDEFKIRQVFIKLLKEFCHEIEVVGETDNIKDGYELIRLTKPSVVFLDIEMPGGNGFELLARFSTPPFEVIFVTSYGHYAIRAIKCSALDYLLKPVMVSDLQELTDKIKRKLKLQSESGNYKALLDNLQKPDMQTLVVITKTKTEYLMLNDIIYLKADSNYTIIQLENNKVHVSKTLKEYDELLCSEGSSFLRIHKGCIVNMNYIKQMNRGENSTVTLMNGVVLEISRRKKQELSDKLNFARSFIQ